LGNNMRHTKSIDIILKTLRYHYGGRNQADIECIKSIVQCDLDLPKLFSSHECYDLLPFFYKIINDAQGYGDTTISIDNIAVKAFVQSDTGKACQP